MFENILVICDGNICRSPTAAAMLAAALPKATVTSAGLVAVVGHEMESNAKEVAESRGLVCPPHQAQQLTAELAASADLLLVMEKRQRNEVMRRFPQASGKVFLLGHWDEGREIPDPYRRDREVFEQVYTMIEQGVRSWHAHL